MPSKLCFSRAIVAALFGLAAFMAVPADAQQWPAKPITIVNGFPAGAGNDIVLRMYQEGLEKELGVALVFEYKPGAGGNVASEYVSKQAGDGYTLLIGTAGTHGINAALYKKLPFDVEADFTPIAPIADVPNVLAVNPTVIDAKTVQEFIAAVKAAPGKFNYGSTGNGASTHLGFAQFNAAAGLDMVHVPYKGSPSPSRRWRTGRSAAASLSRRPCSASFAPARCGCWASAPRRASASSPTCRRWRSRGLRASRTSPGTA